MGADGWIGIGWPKEFGGQGRSPIEQFIFSDEVQRAGFPLPFLTINSVGNTIMQFGTEEQKRDFLPRILQGKLHASIGYTEPEAGTDLASLRTRAVKDGDDYVINGSKVFTSLAEYADYIWLAARTDPDAPKHAGISIFMVDTKLPGFKLTPIWTDVGRAHQRHLLRGRARAEVDAGRRREHGLVADRQPAQPRAHRADVGRPARPHPRGDRASGRRRRAWPTAGASSTSSGCSSTSPACAPSGRCCGCSTGGRRGA